MTPKEEIVEHVTHNYSASCGLHLKIEVEDKTGNITNIRVERPEDSKSEAGKSGSCKSILMEVISKYIKHAPRDLTIKILTGLDEDLWHQKDKIGGGYRCPVAGIGPGKRSCLDRVVKTLLDSQEYALYKERLTKDANTQPQH